MQSFTADLIIKLRGHLHPVSGANPLPQPSPDTTQIQC